MEGFVRKSKGFLPMNLLNPKGESFGTEGSNRMRKIKSRRFERKIGGRFFFEYYFGLFQLI